MEPSRLMRPVVVLGLVLALAAPAAANYSITWRTYEDGHLKMWWTKDGIRITQDPFIDSDVTAPYEYGRIAPTKEINDHHEQWLRAGGKTASTSAMAGMGYPFATFEDYFLAMGVDSISWPGLVDQDEMFNVAIEVDLVAWAGSPMGQAVPLPGTVFAFDSGQCPDLPGHQAFNLDTSQPFSGLMTPVGINTLLLPEPATMALVGLGAAALMARRRRR